VAITIDSAALAVVGPDDAVAVTERLRPQVTVLELEVPRASDFHLAQELLDRKLTGAVVIHTGVVDDGVALAALVAGASAVVAKDGLGNELTEAVRGARSGRVRPRISVAARVEAAGKVHPDDVPILGMLAHATSPADIGEVLGVHERELAGRRRRMLQALLGEQRAP
jgi:two-component system, NarL family, response regulator